MSFDFAALMQFLMKLFEAFKKLAEKLGIVTPEGEDKEKA